MEDNRAGGDRMDWFHRYLQFDSFVRGGVIEPRWLSDGSSFCYAAGAPADTQIYRADATTGLIAPFVDAGRVRIALEQVVGHELPYRGLPFNTFSLVDAGRALSFAFEGGEYICRLDSYAVEPVPTAAREERRRLAPRSFRQFAWGLSRDFPEVLSPDGRWFALAHEHNIWLRTVRDGRAEPITQGGCEDRPWEVESGRWQPWSPDSLKLAVTLVDRTRLTRVPLVHWLNPAEEVEFCRETRAGGPLPLAEPYILDARRRQPLRIDLPPDPDRYLVGLCWTPDSSEFLFASYSRDFKRVDILSACAQTGACRRVLSESSETFVAEQHNVLAGRTGFTLLDDGSAFVWQSERDGWRHLYLYDLHGKLLGQLTHGAYPVCDLIAVDEANGWVYFTAHAEERLYDTHLYRVRLDGTGGFTRLTEGEGQHRVSFTPSRAVFLDQHTNLNRPPATLWRRADGTLLGSIGQADAGRLEALCWTPPEEFVVKAADGETDLYGVLYKPHDFDASRKYPVVEWLYGGPQYAVVQRGFMTGFDRGLAQALAQLGFITFAVDARGTPERSKAFHDVIYGNWGRNEIPDHAAALRQLAETRPYMDLSRVGITGYSWGAYYTVRALLFAPDTYHVGACGGPGFDPWMDPLYEQYLGTPGTENKAAYDYAAVRNFAANLRGKLLIANGTADAATFGESVRFVDALVRAGKPYDLLILPEQGHALSDQGRAYYHDAVARYFVEHLRP